MSDFNSMNIIAINLCLLTLATISAVFVFGRYYFRRTFVTRVNGKNNFLEGKLAKLRKENQHSRNRITYLEGVIQRYQIKLRTERRLSGNCNPLLRQHQARQRGHFQNQN